MRRLFSLVVPLLALVMLAPAALAAVGGNRVVGSCTKSQVSPPQIVLACADYNALVTKIKWKTFGGGTATGSGSFGFNDCTPNCAAGQFHYYAVKVEVADAKRCNDGYDDYRKLKLTFNGRPPKRFDRVFSPTLFCPEP